MKLEKCDRCGRISPDENRLYIANKWVECVARNSNRHAEPIVLCSECWQRALAPESTMLSKAPTAPEKTE